MGEVHNVRAGSQHLRQQQLVVTAATDARPVAIQQGATPVYPVRQLAVAPPKQRGIPLESSLQTAWFPLQQFWGALILPPSGSTEAPQMLPTGWQALPLSQPPPTHMTLPLGLVPPPQHS